MCIIVSPQREIVKELVRKDIEKQDVEIFDIDFDDIREKAPGREFGFS